MKARKYLKALLFTAAFALCAVLAGCGPSEFQLSMFDAEPQVLMAADSYWYGDNNKTITDDRYTAGFGKFTGADTLWDSLDEPADGTVTLSGCADIRSGEFKLVLISESDVTVFYDASAGETAFSWTGDLSNGRWRVKMVGREAEGTLDIQLPGQPS